MVASLNDFVFQTVAVLLDVGKVLFAVLYHFNFIVVAKLSGANPVVVAVLLNVNLVEFLLSWEHLGLMVNVLLATYFMDQILAAAMGMLIVQQVHCALVTGAVDGFFLAVAQFYTAPVGRRRPGTRL